MIINIITDYKEVFLSKYGCAPYRSGMNKILLTKYFNQENFDVEIYQFSDIDFRKMNFKDKFVIYTSSEDIGYHYKSYIEDVILGLHLQGAHLIPDYKFLRANNNKLFMEILRDITDDSNVRSLESYKLGVLEDIFKHKSELSKSTNHVLKTASGAMSKGVSLSNSFDDLYQKARKISKSFNLKSDIKDFIRKYYFKGYKMESRFRNKFIIQEFVPNLKNDWKILVYWDKVYVLKRFVRENDFRASGSGNFVFDKEIPDGLLDFAYSIRQKFDVPNISIDVCYDGAEFYLIEFQAIYFGTTTIGKSEYFYQKSENNWVCIDSKSIIEEVYAESIVKFINNI